MSFDCCPELMGAAEAAEAIGVPVQNLGSLNGMPEPVAYLRATRVWLAEDVRRFAFEYQSRPKVRAHRKGKRHVVRYEGTRR